MNFGSGIVTTGFSGAAARDDRAELQQFRCAVEWPRTRNPRRKAPSHPTPWAWEAQAKLHREAKPPRPDNELLIVGRLGNSLTAVAWSEAVYRPPADPHVLLIFLGVDLAHPGPARTRQGCARADPDPMGEKLSRRHDPYRSGPTSTFAMKNGPDSPAALVFRWQSPLHLRTTRIQCGLDRCGSCDVCWCRSVPERCRAAQSHGLRPQVTEPSNPALVPASRAVARGARQ